MTKDQFMKKLYRLQVIQQMTIGADALTFKVITYVTRDGMAAVEFTLLRGDEWLKSGTIVENDDNTIAKEAVAELNSYISKKGWL